MTLLRSGVDLTHVQPILLAIAKVVVTDDDPPVDRVWAEVEAVIARTLARRSARVQGQFEAFLRFVQVLPIARYGRSFTALPSHQRLAVLTRLERSRVVLVRRGFWAVRTLIFIGYYSRADVAESIGSHATAAGWAERGGTAATVPMAPVLWGAP